jgi:hypothetical protein
LQQAGHAPLLALPASMRALADERSIPVVPLPGDIAQLSQGFNRAGQNPLTMMRVMKENIEPIALDVARAARHACQGADLIVHTFLFTLGAHAFARQLDIPDVSAQFFPMFISSTRYPQLAFPDLPLGPLYNRLTHFIGNSTFAWAQRRTTYAQSRARVSRAPALAVPKPPARARPAAARLQPCPRPA